MRQATFLMRNHLLCEDVRGQRYASKLLCQNSGSILGHTIESMHAQLGHLPWQLLQRRLVNENPRCKQQKSWGSSQHIGRTLASSALELMRHSNLKAPSDVNQSSAIRNDPSHSYSLQCKRSRQPQHMPTLRKRGLTSHGYQCLWLFISCSRCSYGLGVQLFGT